MYKEVIKENEANRASTTPNVKEASLMRAVRNVDPFERKKRLAAGLPF